MKHQKLTTVTRSDLSEGYQSVQSTHAAIQFQYEYPEVSKKWYQESNYIVSLSCSNEEQLMILAYRARDMGLNVSMFYEPDIGDQLTAIAIEPSEHTYKLTKKLPLLFKK